MSISLSLIFFILTSAFLLDYVLKSPAGEVWKNKTKEWWVKLEEIEFDRAIKDANFWFLEFFDLIYDYRFWSIKRVVRSCISTILAVVFVIILTGWENTIFSYWINFIRFDVAFIEIQGHIKSLIMGDIGWSSFWGRVSSLSDLQILFSIVILLSLVNLIPDFISLQETRWIMLLSVRRQQSRLYILFSLDIILTTFVFYAWFLLFIVPLANLLWGASMSYIMSHFSDMRSFLQYCSAMFSFSLSGFLPFLISTYFTSFFWIMFVIFVVIVRGLAKFSRFTRILLYNIAVSERPAMTTAGFALVGLGLGVGISFLIIFIFQMFRD